MPFYQLGQAQSYMGCLLLKERLGTCFQPKVGNKYLSLVPLLSSLPAPHRPNWQVLFLRLQCWLLQSKCSAPCSRSISLSHSLMSSGSTGPLSVRSQQAHETTHRRKNLVEVCLQTHLGCQGDHPAVLLSPSWKIREGFALWGQTKLLNEYVSRENPPQVQSKTILKKGLGLGRGVCV